MRSNVARKLAVVTALALFGVIAMAPAAGAEVYRSKGTGFHIDVSWTEYDPDNTLGLPGNTHVGYFGAQSDQYGTWYWGVVSDFDCDEGEVPWGYHAEVVDEVVETTGEVAAEIVEDIVDSGASTIDPETVVEGVVSEVVDVVKDEHDDFPPGCDLVGERYLDGNETTNVVVNAKAKTVSVTGTINVMGSHGPHGEPGDVMATPPINMTIKGGEWNKYEYSSKSQGPGYSYSDWRAGTSYYGGEVAGSIGAMGFADDDDDESWGGFGTFKYRTVERIR